MPASRDEQLEQYFESMKQLCDFAPFQTWIGDLVAQSENINSVEQVKNNNDLFFRKGQMNMIRLGQNLRENVEILETDYLKTLEPDEEEENPLGLYQS